MDEKGKGKGRQVEALKAEEMENRVAPLVNSLDPNGDGLTGRLKPRDR